MWIGGKRGSLLENMIERLRKVGDRIWFEYHCKESHDSCDALIWYRSHTQATVIAGPFLDCHAIIEKDFEGENSIPKSFERRMNTALVLNYRLSFDDGFQADVFEDELFSNKERFSRSSPPPQIF